MFERSLVRDAGSKCCFNSFSSKYSRVAFFDIPRVLTLHMPYSSDVPLLINLIKSSSAHFFKRLSPKE